MDWFGTKSWHGNWRQMGSCDVTDDETWHNKRGWCDDDWTHWLMWQLTCRLPPRAGSCGTWSELLALGFPAKGAWRRVEAPMTPKFGGPTFQNPLNTFAALFCQKNNIKLKFRYWQRVGRPYSAKSRRIPTTLDSDTDTGSWQTDTNMTQKLNRRRELHS